MKHNYTPTDWELLGRYFADELSAEEREAFSQRMNADSAFNAWVHETQSVWELTEKRPSVPQFDAEKPWEAISQHIQPTATAKRISIFRRPVFQVAAALLLLLSTFGVWKWTESPDYQTLRASHEPLAIQLPDGSEVWLNANSSLTYPREFTGDQRMVTLDGEAFFDVSHDPQHPFMVAGGVSTVKVLGTSFNFDSKKGAAISSLSVTTGKVLFFEGKKMEKDSTAAVVVMAGNHADLKVVDRTFSLNSLANENYLSWKTGKLTFVNTPLSEVIATVEDHYGVSFDFRITPDLTKTMKSTFNQAPLDTILKTLSLTYNWQISRDGDRLVVE